MIKKIAAILAILGFSNFIYADGIYGTIVNVDDTTKTILVDTTYGQKVNMKILPNTEIDMDNCGFLGMDKHGTFKDLTIGTFIEAEIFQGYMQNNTQDQSQNMTIKKIEIDCKKRAY
ncbi:hypothetical protein [Campylobacter insulaenigrae]|uniref:hypothetical protein n=1 Tax=Campylobacter insulaenigrae TaxID=260714 RepID=UPI00164D9F92|nr:hypothetical protein [Campylobacter insulaenigrae]MCR6572811.1 hypothetical protein [Campylobacter insulaenigrae]MCR6581866.1 hypothetical protein [Campylobacter insulaenigrae]MCR6585114.1 hypothetical protein [Campylobacter insulaenigrae]MCR6587906.1 hypothetical protein [Campylobacter insulaenigrae]MCR6594289.1 hypothetical protein [Campylobacter insulaenigrae]